MRTQFSNLTKGSAIIFISVFYVLTWFAYRESLGWATTVNMPESFRVLWITIEDPDKQNKAPGAIFFWLRKLDEAGIPAGEPRAYKTPWSIERAEQAQTALDKMDEGELLNGRMSNNMLNEEDDETSNDSYEQGDVPAGEDGFTPMFEFFDVPPPSLPKKQVN
jgi:hypothetical protein